MQIVEASCVNVPGVRPLGGFTLHGNLGGPPGVDPGFTGGAASLHLNVLIIISLHASRGTEMHC